MVEIHDLEGAAYIDWGLAYAEIYSDDGPDLRLEYEELLDGPALKLVIEGEDGTIGIQAELGEGAVGMLKEALR